LSLASNIFLAFRPGHGIKILSRMGAIDFLLNLEAKPGALVMLGIAALDPLSGRRTGR